jgi:ATP-dependent protease ClpP protease subunit
MPSSTRKIRINGSIKAPGTWFHKSLSKKPTPKRIEVALNSPGGSAFTSVGWYDALSAHPAHVTTSVQALAASGASIVLMAGDHRTMTEGSLLMIHNALSPAYGSKEDLDKQSDVLRKLDDSIVGIYASRTGLSRARIREMMAAETWLTAARAKELGFVDEVLPNKAGPKATPKNHVATMNAPTWAMAIAACAADPKAPTATRWKAAVAQRIAAGMDRSEAIAATSSDEPELYRDFLKAANADRPNALADIARRFA